jgi:hypothetical protein
MAVHPGGTGIAAEFSAWMIRSRIRSAGDVLGSMICLYEA